MRSYGAVEAEVVQRLLLALHHRRIDRQLEASDVRADQERDMNGLSPVRRPGEGVRLPGNFLGEVAVSLQPRDVLGRHQVRGNNDDAAVGLGLDVKCLHDFDVRGVRRARSAVMTRGRAGILGVNRFRVSTELQFRPQPRGLFVIRMPYRQVQRRPGVLIHGRCQITPRSHVAGPQHLVGRRRESRIDAAAADRVMAVPRRAIVVGEYVQVDGPVVALSDRDA